MSVPADEEGREILKHYSALTLCANKARMGPCADMEEESVKVWAYSLSALVPRI